MKRFAFSLLLCLVMRGAASAMLLNTGWQLQDAAKVFDTGATISQPAGSRHHSRVRRK